MLARQQVPNALTLARVLAVPLSVGLMVWLPEARAALLIIFVAAALTDFLDGYLARRWQASSRLGALLDPIADKLLVALMLLYLLAEGAADFLPVCVILLRELTIAGLREFMASQQLTLPVSRGGKWKTALQMLAITLLLISNAFDVDPTVARAGALMLYAAAILAFTSAVGYGRAALKAIR